TSVGKVRGIKNATLTTVAYAAWWIQQSIRRALERAGRLIRIPLRAKMCRWQSWETFSGGHSLHLGFQSQQGNRRVQGAGILYLTEVEGAHPGHPAGPFGMSCINLSSQRIPGANRGVPLFDSPLVEKGDSFLTRRISTPIAVPERALRA